MKLKVLKIALVGSVLCALLTVSAMAANLGAGSVNTSALNLRAEPNTWSQVITVAPMGSGMVINEKLPNGWYKVWYQGYVGYMSSEYINFYSVLNGNFGNGTVKGTSVRLRQGPGYDSTTLTYLDEGTSIPVSGVNGEWYRVEYNGLTAFVHSDYMILTPPGGTPPVQSSPGSSPDSSRIGQQVVDTAKKYLGVPYVWAGTSPSGFDCSGLVYYVYKELGYGINRTAESIYQNGTYVEKSDLQPGDVICFSNNGGGYIGHTGIYIGGGQFVHASSSDGKVIITDLSVNYYTVNYHGARRIA